MEKWDKAYELAVEQTKKQIHHDIKQYFEKRDRIPTLKQYLDDRLNILHQLWVNSWVNKVTAAYSVTEKANYLLNLGLIDENAKEKIIKKIFRDIVKQEAQFDIEGWLVEQFAKTESSWLALYESVKHQQAITREKRKKEKLKKESQDEINDLVLELFVTKRLVLYVYLRYHLATQIFEELQNNNQFQLIGSSWQDEKLVQRGKFQRNQFKIVKDFFEEYTGDLIEYYDYGRMYYDFEQYGDRYGHLVFTYIPKALPHLFSEQFSKVKENYQTNTGEKLTNQKLTEMISNELEVMSARIIEQFSEEYIDDLFELTTHPFSIEDHVKIYERDQIEKQQRLMKEEEERQRKLEEEKRILTDVFEREFLPQGERPTRYVLHIGDTNTGKTYHALEKMKAAESGCYLSPLRLLAIEVFDKLNNEGIPCSLKTGEEEKTITNAKHIACTVEMFHEKDRYDCLVIDEAQMLADKERGFAWFKAITKANAKEVHIIGSRNCQDLLEHLLQEFELTIYDYVREIPLEVENKPFRLEQTKKGDALICFSRKKVLQTASMLQRKGKKVSIIYGSMPPETRKAQVQRFIEGKTSVVVSTDAIGMGLNLPIHRIVFLENEKFDGISRRRLKSQEVKQIAGRAGRKGLYNVGKVAFMSDIKKMAALLEMQDEPLKTFTIAPTGAMFERFQRYSHHLGTFFELWSKFENPKGTIKYALTQEQELYKLVEGTEIEVRLSLEDLYGFLHLPFSTREKGLTDQWLNTLNAIVTGSELPEPSVKRGNLDDVEWSYKAIGLHLLFLYRLGRRTEALYWERLREEISGEADHQLRVTVKNLRKRCKRCGKELSLNHPYEICNSCYTQRYEKWY